MSVAQRSSRTFLALLGGVLAISLAGQPTSLPQVLLLIGCQMLALIVLVGVSMTSVYLRALTWPHKAIILILVGLLIQLALGVPPTVLVIFLIVGVLAGWVAGILPIPPPGILVAGVVAILLVVRQQSLLALADPLQISILSFAATFVLCSVAPAREQPAGWDAADTLLFLSTLFAVSGNQNLSFSGLWLWAFAIMLATVVVAIRRLISHTLLERLIWPRFQQLFVVRMLDLALEQPTAQFINWMELVAESLAAPTRVQVLQRAIVSERIPFWNLWLHGLPHTSALSQSMSEALQAALYTVHQHNTARSWLEAGIQHTEVQVWQPCLDLLQAYDPDMALQICWEVLQDGRVEPCWYCVRQLDLPPYRVAALELLKFARLHPQIPVADALEGQLKEHLNQTLPGSTLATFVHLSKERLSIALITLLGIDADRARRLMYAQPHEVLGILFDGLFIESAIQAYQKRVIHLLAQEANSGSFLIVNACFQVLEHILHVAPAWSEQVFTIIRQGLSSEQPDIQEEALSSLTHLIAEQPNAQRLAKPKALVFGLPSAAVQVEARQVLINAIRDGQPALWQACLNRLTTIDRAAAYRACLLRLRHQHDPAPCLAALTSAGDQEYLQVVAGLIALQRGLPAVVCGQITAQLQQDAGAAPTMRAAGAVLGLASYQPAMLPKIVLHSHQRQLIPVLLGLGGQPSLRPLVVQALRHGLGCQMTPAAQQPLGEAFFPFLPHPGMPETPPYHVEQILAAPATLVDGPRITVWSYQQQQVCDLVLVGYGTPALSARIATSLLHYILEHGDPSGSDWSLLMGVCRLQIRHPDAADSLLSEMQDLAQRSGMLDRQRVEGSHDQIRDQLRASIHTSWDSAPVALRHWNEAAVPQAVILPLDLQSSEQQQLSIDLPIRLFGTGLAAQQEQLRNALHALIGHDAERRLLVYKEWLRADQSAFDQHLEQIVLPIAGTLPPHQRMALIVTWRQQLIDMASTAGQPLAELQASELLRMALDQQGQVIPDRQWQSWLEAQQREVLQLSGQRQYSAALIHRAAEQFVSPLAMALALPAMIQEDLHWIARAEGLLARDQAQQQKLQLIADRLLYDAFLRGCPLTLLGDAGQQSAYRRWCHDQRELVWRAIHADLYHRGLRIDPLLSNNLVFDVRPIDGQLLRITPQFIGDANRLLALNLPHVGMVQYCDPWQYRQVDAQPSGGAVHKAHACRAACAEALLAIDANQPATATQAFRRALQIQPLMATSLIFAAAWRETRRDTRSELVVRRQFARAIDQLLYDQQLPEHAATQAFLEQYPGLLADPYLLRMILNQPASQHLRTANEQLRMLHDSQPEPLDPRLWQVFDQLAKQLRQATVQVAYAQGTEDLTTARLLDPESAEQLREQAQYAPSGRMLQHVLPLVALDRADAYQRITAELTEAIGQQLSMVALRQRLAVQLSDRWLLPASTQLLLELYQQLAADTTPEQARRMVQYALEHLHQQRLLQLRSAAQVTEISEPAMQLAQELRTQMDYRAALQLLIPGATQPIANYPAITWAIEDHGFYQIRELRVELQPHAATVWIGTPQGQKKLLTITGLTQATAQHLQSELTRSDLPSLLREDRPALAPAYAILLTPLPITPQVACWQAVLTCLEPVLLALLASHPSIPISPIAANQAADFRAAIDQYHTLMVIEAIRSGPEYVLSGLDAHGLTIPQGWQNLELR